MDASKKKMGLQASIGIDGSWAHMMQGTALIGAIAWATDGSKVLNVEAVEGEERVAAGIAEGIAYALGGRFNAM